MALVFVAIAGWGSAANSSPIQLVSVAPILYCVVQFTLVACNAYRSRGDGSVAS